MRREEMRVSLPTYGLSGTKKKFKPHGKYRPLAIKYTGETETDKPVKCTISSEEIPFRLLRPDGKDAVFLDENGNILPYWIETKNSTLMQVWLKFPKASKSFLPVCMYYNNLQDVKLSHISAAFKYRRKITITEQSGENLTDYQVCIELDSSNFDFSHAQSDGSDIRFADENGGLLSHWIESWDVDSEQARVWVKIPSLSANSEREIYMYYGNTDLESGSNGEKVFDFFDDFAEPGVSTHLQKIYSCEDGSYGDNEDGKPCALGPNPIVAIYAPSEEKVYITYQGTGFDPYIFYYDEANDTISEAVKIGENPTADVRYGDGHGSPTLWLDPDGYIHVLYGGHGAAIKHKKSTNPYDISSWTSLPDFSSEGTYPYVVADGSNIYVFYRHDNVRWYKKSTDGGDNFGSDVQWMSTGGVYYKFVRKGQKVHFIMWYAGTGDQGKELRYCYFDLNTETFHKIDGTELSMPFAFSDADLAWTSPTDAAEAACIGVDDSDNIYIIAFARQSHDSPATEHADIYAIKWDGSSWQSQDTSLDVEFASGWFYLAVKSSSEIDLYFVEMDENGCGAFRRYSSDDGLSYSLSETIADEKTCRVLYPVYNEDTEPIGGITFDKIITINNVDRNDPHLGLYGDAFPVETTEYSVSKSKWSGNVDAFTREDSLIKCSTSSKWIYTKTYQITDGIVEAKVKIDSGARGSLLARTNQYEEYGTLINSYNINYRYPNGDVRARKWYGGSETILNSSSYSHDTEWHIVRLILGGSDITFEYEKLDGTNKYSYSTSDTDLASGYLGLATDKIASGAVYYDWVRVRKYVSIEPSINISQEEEI